MAKGIPLMGHGPNGKAKMIDDETKCKVQLSGTITEVVKVVDALQ